MNTRIFLDVGSTNSRGWLVRNGQILEARILPVGVRDSAREGGHTGSVRAAVGELVRALAPDEGAYGIAAAEMITGLWPIASPRAQIGPRQGWAMIVVRSLRPPGVDLITRTDYPVRPSHPKLSTSLASG